MSDDDPRGPGSQFHQSKQRVQQQHNAGRDIIITNVRHHPWIAISLLAAILSVFLVVAYVIYSHSFPSPINPSSTPVVSASPSPRLNPSPSVSPSPRVNPWLLLSKETTVRTQDILSGMPASDGMHYLSVGVMFQNTSSQMQSLDPNNLELISASGKVYMEAPGSPKSGQQTVSAGASSEYIGVYFEIPTAKACFTLTVSDSSGGRFGNWSIGDGC